MKRIIEEINKNDNNLILLASRYCDKQSFAIEMASELSYYYNKKILFMSGELSKDQVIERMKLQNNSIAEDIDKLDFIIEDPNWLYLDDIINKATSLKQTKGLDYLFIDYFQLININKGFISAPTFISDRLIKRAVLELKELSQELHIKIIVLLGLSRHINNFINEPNRFIEDKNFNDYLKTVPNKIIILQRNVKEWEADYAFGRPVFYDNSVNCLILNNDSKATTELKYEYDSKKWKFR